MNTKNKIRWSGPREPNKECPYNSVIGQTPFGDFLITWKGWKKNPLYDIDETPWEVFLSGAFDDLEAAKSAAEKQYSEKLAECLDQDARDEIIAQGLRDIAERIRVLDDYDEYCIEILIGNANRLEGTSKRYVDDSDPYGHRGKGGVWNGDMGPCVCPVCKEEREVKRAAYMESRRDKGEYIDDVPDYGDLMTVREFIENVYNGLFVDGDGFGNPVRNGLVNNLCEIPPSRLDKIPKNATHIIWFNK